MNKLVYIFFVFFSFYLGSLLAELSDNGLFNGYKTNQNHDSNSLPSFTKDQYNSLSRVVPNDNHSLSEGYVSYGPTFGGNSNRFNAPNNEQPYDSGSSLNSESDNPPFFDNTNKSQSFSRNPRSTNSNQKITSRRISGVDNNPSNERFVYNDSNSYDSGIPINENYPVNVNPSQNNTQYGQVDTNVYYAQLPSDYLRNTLDMRNRYSPSKVIYKKQIKYPKFLLFANDVICTTERGITDGMIFYTPHGTYKLKGNLLMASNDSYLISGNKIWLDNMIYYFDDSGVYLNNKIYNFDNKNVMYRNGIKYIIEGTVVTSEGDKGNRKCIISELVTP